MYFPELEEWNDRYSLSRRDINLDVYQPFHLASAQWSNRTLTQKYESVIKSFLTSRVIREAVGIDCFSALRLCL